MDKVLWCLRNWKPKALGTKIKNPLGPDNSKVSAHLRCIKVSYMRHFPIFTSFSPHKPCRGGWAGQVRRLDLYCYPTDAATRVQISGCRRSGTSSLMSPSPNSSFLFLCLPLFPMWLLVLWHTWTYSQRLWSPPYCWLRVRRSDLWVVPLKVDVSFLKAQVFGKIWTVFR